MLRSSLPISSQSPGAGPTADRLIGNRVRLITLGVTALSAFVLSGCGVAEPEPEAAVKPIQLQVSPAKFSKKVQRPGEEVTLSMTIKNVGSNPAPEPIVQLMGNEETTLADPREEGRERTEKDDLPDAVTRAAWFVDATPAGDPPFGSNDLYPSGGALPAGESRTLRWTMNPSQPGDHKLTYQVFGGLTDKAAKATSGTGLTGSVNATIRDE